MHGSYYGGHAALTASPPTTGSSAIELDTDWADGFYVSVSAQTVYMTMDGTTPSSTNGLTLPAGTVQLFPLKTAKLLFQAAAAGATVNVQPLS